MASVVESNSEMSNDTHLDHNQETIDLINKLNIENELNVVAVTTPDTVDLKTKNGSEDNLLLNIDVKHRKRLDKLIGKHSK